MNIYFSIPFLNISIMAIVYGAPRLKIFILQLDHAWVLVQDRNRFISFYLY
jgi:hypothetical protein